MFLLIVHSKEAMERFYGHRDLGRSCNSVLPMLDANNFFHVEERNKYSTFCASVVHNRIALLYLNVVICV